MSASNIVPWHGKGEVVEECNTVEDCMEKAGLGFTVSKRTLYVDGADDGEVVSVPTHWATHRDDKPAGQSVLGIVKKDYEVLQNVDAFRAFNPFKESGEITFETAGVLDEGRQVWILARFKEEVAIIADDIVRQYMLIANGHDGVNSVLTGFCSGRVVCWNTLTAALQEHSNWVKIPHRKNVGIAVERAGEMLKEAREYFKATTEMFQAMTRVKMNDAKAEAFIRSVYDRPACAGPVWQAQPKLMRLWETGTGMDLQGVRGTLWAAYNAVTEYEDHVKALREDTCRFKRSWMTDGARVKGRAFGTAQAILTGDLKLEDMAALNYTN